MVAGLVQLTPPEEREMSETAYDSLHRYFVSVPDPRADRAASAKRPRSVRSTELGRKRIEAIGTTNSTRTSSGIGARLGRLNPLAGGSCESGNTSQLRTRSTSFWQRSARSRGLHLLRGTRGLIGGRRNGIVIRATSCLLGVVQRHLFPLPRIRPRPLGVMGHQIRARCAVQTLKHLR